MSQPRWLALAWGDLGVAETPGAVHTARIVRFYADVGHAEIKADETAWCAAFLGSCLERAGLASTRSLMARSYLTWGQPHVEFRPGAVAVLSRTADPALGHVGFLVGETADSLILLGGNQRDSVSVAAYPRARLLGLRWPSPVIPEAEASAEAIRDLPADPGFARALAHVLQMEGGWTDDPYDPGGPTNFGITLATYARDKGADLTADSMAVLKAELRSIPRATVRRIYRQRYWRPAACPQLPAALAFFHFDAAVNQGVTGAARLLQEAVGAEVDGEIGPETLGKAAARPLAQTLPLYAEARRRHYRSLSTFWRFGKGWLARVDRTLSAARAIAQAPPSPSQQQEPPAMTDTTHQPPAAPDSKWWGQSMTIWGVILTGLSTVLPAVGPLIGLDITAELIRQLGDQIVVLVQAIGGLIGTILTIWGRARATTALERKQLTMNL
ncbi:MAG: TIGR02594 family protein [Hyphomonadaceae bacterium]|nr:TIGR02594 family protein [Hyphomonadaceae bacterium]